MPDAVVHFCLYSTNSNSISDNCALNKCLIVISIKCLNPCSRPNSAQFFKFKSVFLFSQFANINLSGSGCYIQQLQNFEGMGLVINLLQRGAACFIYTTVYIVFKLMQRYHNLRV